MFSDCGSPAVWIIGDTSQIHGQLLPASLMEGELCSWDRNSFFFFYKFFTLTFKKKKFITYLFGCTGNFLDGSAGKESASNAGDTGDVSSIPGLVRSPGGGHANTLQYSYLENPMDRRAWRDTVHGVTKSQTRLSTWHTDLHCSIWDLVL